MGFYYSFWIFRFENKLNWTKIHTSLVCCVRHSKSILRTICFGRIYNSVHVDRWNTRIRFHLTEYNLIDMFFMIKSVEWPLGIHCVLITLDGYSGSSSARRLFRAFFIWNELIANSFKTSFREYVRRRNYIDFIFVQKHGTAVEWQTLLSLKYPPNYSCYRRRRRRWQIL